MRNRHFYYIRLLAYSVCDFHMDPCFRRAPVIQYLPIQLSVSSVSVTPTIASGLSSYLGGTRLVLIYEFSFP